MTTPTSTQPTLADAKELITSQYKAQLANHPLKETKPLDTAGGVPNSIVEKVKRHHGDSLAEPANQDQINASREAATAIAEAVEKMGLPAKGVKSDRPDWDIVKLCFLASSCMYLRDPVSVAKAAHAENQDDKTFQGKSSTTLLEESRSLITEVCQLWGMSFTTICDLTGVLARENYDGPFCGAFIREDPVQPFIIITFRGTSTFLEWVRDAHFIPHDDVDHSILWGTKIHPGFNSGIFEKFKGYPDTPFVMIEKALLALSASLRPAGSILPVPIYFTGHSLGGAYATLTFSQLLFLPKVTTNIPTALGNTVGANLLLKSDLFEPRDLYTFGAPRVGVLEFAQAVTKALGPSQNVWRIVNGRDPVAWVPGYYYPSFPDILAGRVGFYHLDKGAHMNGGTSGSGWDNMESELVAPPVKSMRRKRKRGMDDGPQSPAPVLARGEQENDQVGKWQPGDPRLQGRKLIAFAYAYPSFGQIAPQLAEEEINAYAKIGIDAPEVLLKKGHREWWNQVREVLSPGNKPGTDKGKVEKAKEGGIMDKAVKLGIPNVFDHRRGAYWTSLKLCKDD